MIKKAILGLALAAFSTLGAGATQAKAEHHYSARLYYPKGYYYSHGHWRPYRGYRHPYRGGYYDRWGHWHSLHRATPVET